MASADANPYGNRNRRNRVETARHVTDATFLQPFRHQTVTLLAMSPESRSHRSLVALVATILAATLVAQTALDLLVHPSLVEAAWREFRGEG